jgi:hypothetical protein
MQKEMFPIAAYPKSRMYARTGPGKYGSRVISIQDSPDRHCPIEPLIQSFSASEVPALQAGIG